MAPQYAVTIGNPRIPAPDELFTIEALGVRNPCHVSLDKKCLSSVRENDPRGFLSSRTADVRYAHSGSFSRK
jgi:hypothetical protein